jgi:hypothetical protein
MYVYTYIHTYRITVNVWKVSVVGGGGGAGGKNAEEEVVLRGVYKPSGPNSTNVTVLQQGKDSQKIKFYSLRILHTCV